jgi:hypothetical protein
MAGLLQARVRDKQDTAAAQDEDALRQLIEEGKTREVLSGFRSRAGKPFRARLVLNDEDKIEFEFPVRAQTKEPAATE